LSELVHHDICHRYVITKDCIRPD